MARMQRLPDAHNQQQHDLFIVEVVAAWADPTVFRNGRWGFQTGGSRTLHYSAGGQFSTGEACKPIKSHPLGGF